jgi:glycerol-3-phosphate dehydrogenase (NAD(P)+)
MKISILGSGAFGTAIGVLLSRKNNMAIQLWTPFESEAKQLSSSRQHPALKNVKLNDQINITSDMESAVSESEIIILATPSAHVRETARKLKSFWNNQLIVSIAKGVEQDSLLRMSEIIEEEIPNSSVAVVSGPSHAEEMALLMPTVCVLAYPNLQVTEHLKNILQCPSFNLFTTTDKIGVELGGALKNVLALAAGICDGIGLGDNAVAALATLGAYEIAKIGKEMGADPNTFFGLSGVGDIIVTCTSRNRRAGILIGNGKKIPEVLTEVGAVVEGIDAAKSAHQLCEKYKVNAPLLSEIYKVIFEHKPADESLKYLMSSNLR